MIYILHGEDTASSRAKLTTLIDGAAVVVRVDGKKQSVGQVLDAFASNALFSERRTIVVESFVKIKPQDVFLKNISQFENDQNTSVILWENALIDKRVTGKIKGLVLEFSFPKYFYTFLDGLAPKNSTKSVVLLKKLLETSEPEQILYSLVKRMRQLILIRSGAYKESSEFVKMGDWQLSKLKNQADLWSLESLQKLYIKFAEADELIKTSGLNVPLAKHLDILLLSI